MPKKTIIVQTKEGSEMLVDVKGYKHTNSGIIFVPYRFIGATVKVIILSKKQQDGSSISPDPNLSLQEVNL